MEQDTARESSWDHGSSCTTTHKTLKGKNSGKNGADTCCCTRRASRGNNRQGQVAAAVHYSSSVVVRHPPNPAPLKQPRSETQSCCHGMANHVVSQSVDINNTVSGAYNRRCHTGLDVVVHGPVPEVD